MTYWKTKTIGIFILIWIIVLVPSGLAAAQGEDEARVGFFEDYEAKPGSRIEVPVQIEDVQDLYGIDIEIRFDPNVIMIEDADPETDGIQPALGTFLDAGLTLFNTADNEAGVVHFVMSQMRPSEPKSGDGIIIVLYVQGLAEGESVLEITNLQLSTSAGEEISAQPVEGKVIVSESAVPKESTPIPVQEPTTIVVVQTAQPTATPVNTPTPTSEEIEAENSETLESTTEADLSRTTTPTTHAVSQEDSDPQPINTTDESAAAENAPNNQSGFTLVRHWWIVALVLVIAVGLGGYLLWTQKRV